MAKPIPVGATTVCALLCSSLNPAFRCDLHALPPLYRNKRRCLSCVKLLALRESDSLELLPYIRRRQAAVTRNSFVEFQVTRQLSIYVTRKSRPDSAFHQSQALTNPNPCVIADFLPTLFRTRSRVGLLIPGPPREDWRYETTLFITSGRTMIA